MPDVLLEIGTEELPPDFVASGEAQLRDAVERRLDDARLGFERIETFATPRRLAVLARGVADRQEPATSERRGPPVDRARDADGAFTKAAVGFANSAGVDVTELVQRSTEQGEYLFAIKQEPGSPARDVLPDVLSAAIGELSYTKTMRWDASGVRFPRPIRWLLALADADVLDVRRGELRAARSTMGHRLLHRDVVEVPAAGSYADVLRDAHVIADRHERREVVRREAERAAASLDGRPVLHDALLDEVTDLVEQPVALAGRFDASYLDVPRDVLITSMESHLRHFAVEDASGKLVPGFVCVSNASPDNADVVVRGNERVLRARLEDARFFFAEDLKTPLSVRADALEDVVFHAQLGSLGDKARRTASLVRRFSDWLDLEPQDADAAAIAAEVCKADLLTHVVYEFPELQGVMGREYALRDGRMRERAGDGLERAASAIAEHYLPRFAQDALPATPAGTVLALADRLDTLTGYLGVGLSPSGSEDPFALRRAATAFAQVSLAADARIPLTDAVTLAHRLYTDHDVDLGDPAHVVAGVRDLLRSRTEALLEREGVRPLFVAAAAGAAWSDLPDLAERARALGSLQQRGALHRLAVVHERAFNLSRGVEAAEVDPSALAEDAERSLHERLAAVEPVVVERAAARDYPGALEALGEVATALERFFEEVLVMAPDDRLKRNRLALLARTAAAFALVADFSGVEPKLLHQD